MKATFKRDINGLYLDIQAETTQEQVQINELAGFSMNTCLRALPTTIGVRVVRRQYINPAGWESINPVQQLLGKTTRQGWWLVRSAYKQRTVVIVASLKKDGNEEDISSIKRTGGMVKVYEILSGTVPESFTVAGTTFTYSEELSEVTMLFDDVITSSIVLKKSSDCRTIPELRDALGIK